MRKSRRNVVVTAIQAGVATPAFSASLAYYDSYRDGQKVRIHFLQSKRLRISSSSAKPSGNCFLEACRKCMRTF